MLAKAASISSAVLALRTSILMARLVAAPRRSLMSGAASSEVGLTSEKYRDAFGTSSRNNPSRLAASSAFNEVIPVMLPPGRLRLGTRPSATGSVPEEKTIGMVEVAALATTAAAVLPGVAISVTLRRIRSAAIAGSSSFLPEAQ
jgi:hypothetical protein